MDLHVASQSSKTINALVSGVIKAGKDKDLQNGRLLHCYLLQAGSVRNKHIASALITMYGKCRSMQNARRVFDNMVQRDVVLWTVLIHGYVENGEGLIALEVFSNMDCKPDGVTFVAALKACVSIASTDKEYCLMQGSSIHRKVKELRLDTDKYVGSSLVEMYSKCNRMVCAREVFDCLTHRDVISWTVLVVGYVENGQCQLALDVFHAMDCAPTAVTYVCALKACISLCRLDKRASLEKGLEIHKRAKKCGLDRNVFVANTLMEIYSKCNSMKEAREVFSQMSKRNVVSWTILIVGYTENGESTVALNLFKTMNCTPDRLTVVAALNACARLGKIERQTCLEEGLLIHKIARKFGIHKDMYVSNSLLDMYSKCGDMLHARETFEEMRHRDVVSWTSLILGYTESGDYALAVDVFESMDCAPDSVTLAAALKACAGMASQGDLGKMRCSAKGLSLHKYLIKRDLDKDVFLASSLIDMYGKCGNMLRARKVFEEMTERSIVSWNVLILGYIDNGDCLSALDMFNSMDCVPDSITFSASLRACGSLGALETGRIIEIRICELKLERNDMVATSLVDFYAKCGNMSAAENAFSRVHSFSNIAVWNALIGGYAQLGDTFNIFRLVKRMQEASLQIDDVTMLLLLMACSHEGLAEEGQKYFKSMSKYGINPTVEHYTCMVDMLCRMNRLEEAWLVVKSMPFEANSIIWMQLLAACVKSNNRELQEVAFRAIVTSERP